jgi:hypothetical protein
MNVYEQEWAAAAHSTSSLVAELGAVMQDLKSMLKRLKAMDKKVSADTYRKSIDQGRALVYSPLSLHHLSPNTYTQTLTTIDLGGRTQIFFVFVS